MDDAPRHTKPNIGRRLLSRQAAVTRAAGMRLGRIVTARHETPEPVRAAMRLVPNPAGIARAAAAAPAPAPAAPAPAPAPAASEAWVPSPTESTIVPGISDWAADWMFGDGDTAVAAGDPFVDGAIPPRTAEEKKLARLKRGGPEVARAARILEGDELPPSQARVARTPSEPPRSTPSEPAPPSPAAGPVRVSRTPAAPPTSTPAADTRPTVARTPAP